MRSWIWRSHPVAVALLAIQLGVSVLGVAGLCVDRPHTHLGVPAPDCVMHGSHPAGTAPEPSQHGHHGHHGAGTPAGTAQFGCSCSSDRLTLMTTEIAVVPIVASMQPARIDARALAEHVRSVPDVRLSPLSPPPRYSLS